MEIDFKKKIKLRADNNNGMMLRIPNQVCREMNLQVGEVFNLEADINNKTIVLKKED